jgi:hypothetical protein
MYSNKFISDFYDDLKSNQQELINNKYNQCGGFSITDKQLKQANLQNKFNIIKNNIKDSINNKVNNLLSTIEQTGGGSKTNNTYKSKIKSLISVINKSCKEEAKMVRNIKKQQECIKKGKTLQLAEYQKQFDKNMKIVQTNNAKIIKKETQLTKSLSKLNDKIKNKKQMQLAKEKKKINKQTYNKLQLMLKKIR